MMKRTCFYSAIAVVVLSIAVAVCGVSFSINQGGEWRGGLGSYRDSNGVWHLPFTFTEAHGESTPSSPPLPVFTLSCTAIADDELPNDADNENNGDWSGERQITGGWTLQQDGAAPTEQYTMKIDWGNGQATIDTDLTTTQTQASQQFTQEVPLPYQDRIKNVGDYDDALPAKQILTLTATIPSTGQTVSTTCVPLQVTMATKFTYSSTDVFDLKYRINDQVESGKTFHTKITWHGYSEFYDVDHWSSNTEYGTPAPTKVTERLNDQPNTVLTDQYDCQHVNCHPELTIEIQALDGRQITAHQQCFAEESTVTKQSGEIIAIKDLRAGDEIFAVTQSGEIITTPVLYSSGSNPTRQKSDMKMICLDTASEMIELTPDHTVYAKKSEDADFSLYGSKYVQVGDVLRTVKRATDGTLSLVEESVTGIRRCSSRPIFVATYDASLVVNNIASHQNTYFVPSWFDYTVHKFYQWKFDFYTAIGRQQEQNDRANSPQGHKVMNRVLKLITGIQKYYYGHAPNDDSQVTYTDNTINSHKPNSKSNDEINTIVIKKTITMPTRSSDTPVLFADSAVSSPMVQSVAHSEL